MKPPNGQKCPSHKALFATAFTMVSSEDARTLDIAQRLNVASALRLELLLRRARVGRRAVSCAGVCGCVRRRTRRSQPTRSVRGLVQLHVWSSSAPTVSCAFCGVQIRTVRLKSVHDTCDLLDFSSLTAQSLTFSRSSVIIVYFYSIV